MEKFLDLPGGRNRKCFGCSPANAAGLQMRFATDGESVVSSLKVPDHLCGWDNLVHGGVVATILDEVMSWAALHLLKKIIMTKSVTIDFIKPVLIGTVLTAKARVLEVKDAREAVMEGTISNDRDQLCARSEGTFVLFTAKVAERLKIMDAQTLKTFQGLIDDSP